MGIKPENVTAIILNYKTPEFTMLCLKFIYSMIDRPGKVIVVDNASEDGSIKRISEKWATLLKNPIKVLGINDNKLCEANILPLTENFGFSSGNNAAIKRAIKDANCKAIWLLNNDTKPISGSLSALCAEISEDKKVGIVGSTLIEWNNKNVIQTLGGGKFNKYLGTTKNIWSGKSLTSITNINTEEIKKQLNYICGASMLIRNELFINSNFLPEEYFLYYEDVDFSLKAQKKGYSISWAKDSYVTHYNGATTGDKSELTRYLSTRNRTYLIKKYYPKRILFCVFATVISIFLSVKRRKIKHIQHSMKGSLHALQNKMGKVKIKS